MDTIREAFEAWWNLPEHALAQDHPSDKWIAEKAWKACLAMQIRNNQWKDM